METISPWDENIINLINRDLFCIIDPNKEHSHTIGMAKYGLPDLLISSKQLEANSIILSLIAEDWIENGLTLTDRNDFFKTQNEDAITLKFSVLNSEELMFTKGMEFYSKFSELSQLKKPALVQVLWPDPHGFYAMDKEYDKGYYQYYFRPISQYHNH